MGWERNATVQGVTGGTRNIIRCSRKGEVHGDEGRGVDSCWNNRCFLNIKNNVNNSDNITFSIFFTRGRRLQVGLFVDF